MWGRRKVSGRFSSELPLLLSCVNLFDLYYRIDLEITSRNVRGHNSPETRSNCGHPTNFVINVLRVVEGGEEVERRRKRENIEGGMREIKEISISSLRVMCPLAFCMREKHFFGPPTRGRETQKRGTAAINCRVISLPECQQHICPT